MISTGRQIMKVAWRVSICVGFLGLISIGAVIGKQIPLEKTKHITVGNWGAIKYDPATLENMKLWEQQTGIKVKYVEVPAEQAQAKYMSMFMARSGAIDTFDYDPGLVFQYSRAGWLEPLDDLYPPEIRKEYADAFWEAYIQDGHVWGSPHFGAGFFVVGNKQMLKDAGYSRLPQTWNELVEYAQKLTRDLDGDGVPDIYGYSYHFGRANEYETFLTILSSIDGKYHDEEGRVRFSFDEELEAVQLMVDLRNKYKVVPPDVIGMSGGKEADMFLAERLAMYQVYSPHLMTTLKPWLEEDKLLYDLFPGKELGQVGAELEIAGYYVNVNSTKKEAVRSFLKFMAGDQAQKNELLIEADLPLLKRTVDDPEVKVKPYADLVKRLLEVGMGWTGPYPELIRDQMFELVGSALRGTLTAEEAMKNLDEKALQIQEELF